LCDDVDLDRDRALVERCQAGDSAAFGNLYARYYERLLRFCQRRLNDRHEAEDAAQEAFARAWKALPNFAGERRFYPWLTVIAGNICTDMLRRRSRSTPTDDVELGSHQPVGGGGSETSEELVLAAVDGELVNRALDRLSVRHQHVLAMREGSGWSYQQIADHEGVEIGTIETLLWRARQALKREFNVLSDSKGAFGGFLVGAGSCGPPIGPLSCSKVEAPTCSATPWPVLPSPPPLWLPPSLRPMPSPPVTLRRARPQSRRRSSKRLTRPIRRCR
jgi:RNA polymerase sigma-70 factor (ECF subfamily)